MVAENTTPMFGAVHQISQTRIIVRNVMVPEKRMTCKMETIKNWNKKNGIHQTFYRPEPSFDKFLAHERSQRIYLDGDIVR